MNKLILVLLLTIGMSTTDGQILKTKNSEYLYNYDVNSCLETQFYASIKFLKTNVKIHLEGKHRPIWFDESNIIVLFKERDGMGNELEVIANRVNFNTLNIDNEDVIKFFKRYNKIRIIINCSRQFNHMEDIKYIINKSYLKRPY